MELDYSKGIYQTSSLFLRYLLLTVCFFVFGIILGHIGGYRVLPEISVQVQEYLLDYVFLQKKHGIKSESFLLTLIIYFRYPVAALFFSLSTLRVILVPILTIVYGFSLSIAASCLSMGLGRNGVLLAFSLLGIRCMFSLPCYFLITVPIQAHGGVLQEQYRGKRQRIHMSELGSKYLILLLDCIVVLLVGASIEYKLGYQLILRVFNQLF